MYRCAVHLRCPWLWVNPVLAQREVVLVLRHSQMRLETVSGSAEPVCLHERNNSSVISRLMSVDLCPTGLSGPPPAGTERLRHCSCSCDNLNFSKFFRRHDVNVRSSSAVQAKTSANLDCCPRAIFP